MKINEASSLNTDKEAVDRNLENDKKEKYEIYKESIESLRKDIDVFFEAIDVDAFKKDQYFHFTNLRRTINSLMYQLSDKINPSYKYNESESKNYRLNTVYGGGEFRAALFPLIGIGNAFIKPKNLENNNVELILVQPYKDSTYDIVWLRSAHSKDKRNVSLLHGMDLYNSFFINNAISPKTLDIITFISVDNNYKLKMHLEPEYDNTNLTIGLIQKTLSNNK